MSDEQRPDLRAAVAGDRWTVGPIVISSDRVAEWAELTGDGHPLHLDASFASASVFGRRIAHGLLVLSRVLGEAAPAPESLSAFLGMDAVRFRAPVFIGDMVHGEMTVQSLRRMKGGRVAHVEVRIHREDEILAITGTLMLLVPDDR